MSPEEILNQIKTLDPKDRNISAALSLLRLVVQNNQDKTVQQLLARRDVRESIGAIQDWISEAEKIAESVAAELPRGIARKVREDTSKTLSKLTEETAFNEERLGAWKSDSIEADAWAARVILRMQWLVDWLRKQAEWMKLKSPYKRWVSRLAPNTCKYCKALHNVIIPIGESFAVEAKKAGFERVYGGLWGPPLHPSCQCRLVPSEG